MEEPPVRFELVKRTTLPETGDVIFAAANYLNKDSKGNYYFMDRRQNIMASVSPEGGLRWVHGQKGRGPGDFESISNMKIIQDTILVSNIQGTRIDRFDLSGNFLSSSQLPKDAIFANIEGITSDETLVLSSTLWGKLGRTVHIVESSGDSLTVLNTFPVLQGEAEIGDGMSSSASLTVYKDKIISGNTSGYRILHFDLEGTLTSIIERDFDKIVRPGYYESNGSSSIRTYGDLSSPYFLNDGSFFIRANWPTNVDDPDEYLRKSRSGTAPDIISAHTYDYYSSQGEILYSFEGEGWTPEMGHFIFIDEQDHAYTITSDESVTINKYKIIIQES